MNLDLSIHRMAFRETDSMGVAQALIARKRQELELRLLREQVAQSGGAAGAQLDSALRDMEDEARSGLPVHVVDKRA